MSDYYSSMPVRTSRETGDIQNVLIAGLEGLNVRSMKVDTSGQVYVIADNLDIRDLDAAQDSILICGSDGSSTNPPISVDASGNINVNIVSGAGGYQYQDGVAAAGAYGNVMVGTDGTNLQFVKVDTSGYIQVDVAVQTLTALKISKDANANSETNPIFVKVTDMVQGGEVHEYDTTAAVGKGLTANHDYTVTGGKTLMLKGVLFSASGAMKAEVQVGPLASLATKAVGFNSSANLMGQIVFDPPIEVPDTSTGTVRVIVTNRDNQSQDLYTTIMGVER